MHVCELFGATRGSVCPVVLFRLLHHAELRGVTDARDFLVGLGQWGVCEPEVAWALRKAYNSRVPEPQRLWVPLTA